MSSAIESGLVIESFDTLASRPVICGAELGVAGYGWLSLATGSNPS
jgi:hypothetical protein